MRIGEVIATTGLSARMVRHYEKIGLLPGPSRLGNLYRDYGPADVARLRFIVHARDAGLSTDETRVLLQLWDDRARSGTDVGAAVRARIEELEDRRRLLEDIVVALQNLAQACDDGSRPNLPTFPAGKRD